jgi:hypothetical protein
MREDFCLARTRIESQDIMTRIVGYKSDSQRSRGHFDKDLAVARRSYVAIVGVRAKLTA